MKVPYNKTQLAGLACLVLILCTSGASTPALGQIAGPGMFLRTPAGPACGGQSVGGACWYLAADGESCTTACAARGGTTAATLNYAGSAGSKPNCEAVMAAFGVVTETLIYPIDSQGLGCRSYSGGYVWAASPPTVDAAAVAAQRRVCACAN